MNDRENGERGSGISVLAARHDEDDDDIFEVNVMKQLSAQSVGAVEYTDCFSAEG